MKLGSLFSGSGGFEMAAKLAGIETAWASEIEPLPMRVTMKNFPEAMHLGDISRINGAKIPKVDIISGGSPCQDMSIAGRREGLDGERSGLFRQQIRIVKEMREDDRRNGAKSIRPRYMVWENVPGAFSSNSGEDFRCVLEEIARIAESDISIPRPPGKKGKWNSAGCIMGDGWSIAWRVMDAQFWGVPQRRRRIYLVADFAGYTPPQILFKREGLSWNSAKSIGEGQGTAKAPEGSTGETGGSAQWGGYCIENHPADSRVRLSDEEVVQTLTSRMGTGGGNVPLIMDELPVAFGVCGKTSNSMLSDNPHSGFYEAETSRTIDCRGGDPTCNQGGIVVVGKAPTYALQGNMIDQLVYIVRRLTPLECGRLQGFPDGYADIEPNEEPSASDLKFWTQVWAEHWALIDRSKGTKAPKDEKAVRRWLKGAGTDSDLYKMWGNGIALPCATFVMRGIAELSGKENIYD